MREVQDAQKSVLDLESFPTSEDVLSFIETYTGEMFAFACRAGGMMAKVLGHNTTFWRDMVANWALRGTSPKSWHTSKATI